MFKAPKVTPPNPPANSAIQASFQPVKELYNKKRARGPSAPGSVTGASAISAGRPSLLGGS